MSPHEIFNIVYSVSLVGTSSEYQLTRTFFMRSGVRLPYSTIIEMYEEIKRVVNSKGYSEPMDFLKDFFPGEDFRKMPIFKKNLGVPIRIEKPPVATHQEAAGPAAPAGTNTGSEEPKRLKMQSPRNDSVEREVVNKPIKIKKEVIGGSEQTMKKDTGDIAVKKDLETLLEKKESPYEISIKDRNRISKYKKNSKRFKEMDHKEKEIDNRYDYHMHKAKFSASRIGSRAEKHPAPEKTRGAETGEAYWEDNREVLEENPFMSKMYSDMDLDFREVMFKIYKHNRAAMKDKTKLGQELEFLQEYFDTKLEIGKDADCAKKLTNTIAYLMRKIQVKIFECDDEAETEILLYFKTKLSAFYNFYRK